jgi:hypothetical protein
LSYKNENWLTSFHSFFGKYNLCWCVIWLFCLNKYTLRWCGFNFQYSNFFSCFGVWTQNLAHARQVFYHWDTSQVPASTY